MAYLNACHRGLAYGDGYLQGNGTKGQFVSVCGDDLFKVNTDPAAVSFGMLINDYKAGEMPGIFTGGGIYETDVFEGTVTPGDQLKVSTNGILTAGVSGSDRVVAQAISVRGSILKFRLYN